ncbi:putative hydrolase [Streptomyces himastatinicus ATCC 53653]|uniref:Putative hydrolase n=1 Tax=Streptomyces himastatinicus ATCC 53653 TaxID=457427 RepID=D9WCL3_9ACTN|nr:putative hydrolase [Streptomyces himastatinicus ATCC 53653]
MFRQGGHVRLRSALTRPIVAALVLALGVLGLLTGPGPAVAAASDDRDPDPVINGLRGDYYLQSAPGAFDFHELKATTLDPSLDFDNLEPRLQTATGRSDDVSVRWTGRIVPERSGTHTFSITGDNGFRLWIDGRPVIDHWVDDWDKEQVSGPVELTAGRAYDIKVEYFEHYGGSNFHLAWTPPGKTKEPVPASAFRLPPDFGYEGPVSSAVQPDGRTLLMDFARPLAAPPAGPTGHLTAVIGGAAWPLGAARLDPADRSRLLLTLKEPVVGRGGEAIVRYDGEGGLENDQGAVGQFLAFGGNKSTYQLSTPWAKDVGPDNAHPEYPRPQLTRERWKNLNGTWQFAAAEKGQAPPFGQRLREDVLVPYPVESELSGLERHEDRMWYRRTFTVPANWKVGDGQRLKLNFDAVDWQAQVYVNGTRVAEHRGGYDRFSADVTDALRPGRTQELLVGVYDQTDARDGENPPMGTQRLDPSGIFYPPSSGIWQTVGWSRSLLPRRQPQADPGCAGQGAHRGGPRRTGRRAGHRDRVRREARGRHGDRAHRLGADRAGTLAPAVVAGRSVSVPAEGDRRAGREGRPGDKLLRHAQHRGRGGRRQEAHGAQREAVSIHGHARPGLLAGRSAHRADGPGPGVRPEDAQADGVQLRAQAHQGRTRPLVLLGRPARADGVAGHARHEHHRALGAVASAVRARDEGHGRPAHQQPVDRHLGHLQRGVGPVRRAEGARARQGLGPVPAHRRRQRLERHRQWRPRRHPRLSGPRRTAP